MLRGPSSSPSLRGRRFVPFPHRCVLAGRLGPVTESLQPANVGPVLSRPLVFLRAPYQRPPGPCLVSLHFCKWPPPETRLLCVQTSVATLARLTQARSPGSLPPLSSFCCADGPYVKRTCKVPPQRKRYARLHEDFIRGIQAAAWLWSLPWPFLGHPEYSCESRDMHRPPPCMPMSKEKPSSCTILIGRHEEVTRRRRKLNSCTRIGCPSK
ncbi:hypothetical protein V8C26DRAFT_266490 [Trichoderma gracile]